MSEHQKYPWYAWVILVLACVFVGGGWFWIWQVGEPPKAMRIIGMIVGVTVFLVPIAVGIYQGVKRRKAKREMVWKHFHVKVKPDEQLNEETDE